MFGKFQTVCFLTLLLAGYAVNASIDPLRELQLKVQCGVYDQKGELIRRIAPSAFCIYENDGSVISADENSIVKLSKNLVPLWIKGLKNAHHMMSESADKSIISVLGIEIHNWHNKAVRFDTINLISKKGLTLRRVDTFDIRAQLAKALKISEWPIERTWTWLDTRYEFTHFNAIREIPENKLEKTIPAFTKGNYLITSAMPNGLLIFNKTLSRILWSYIPKATFGIHDGNVTPEGKILFYNNNVNTYEEPFSALEMYDPRERKITWRYEGTPEKRFYSAWCGGIQNLPNGLMAFTEVGTIENTLNRLHIIDDTGKLISSFDLNPKVGTDPCTHEISFRNYTSFLKFNKGL